MRHLPLLLLPLLTGCPLLSLSELESKDRSRCSTAKPCATGWTCGTDGLCREDTGGACRDGDMQACGMTEGECEAGAQVCRSGAFGACVGAVGPVSEVCDGKDNDCDGTPDEDAVDSPACPLDAGVCAGKRAACGASSCSAAIYGSDYELVESRCDMRDNDCDGMTDEGITMPCGEQRGECAGARASCANGAFPACTSTTYFQNDIDYETSETKCDGKDNDCDGRIDAAAPINVSATPGRSRSPAAVLTPTGDALVYWEEEEPPGSGSFKVRTRLVRQDNSMSAIIAPSSTAAAAARSSVAAVAVDGAEIVAAWAEEVTVGGVKRVVVIPADPMSGASRLNMMSAISALSGAMVTNPTDIAVAVDAQAQRVLLAVVDNGALNLARLNLPLGGATTQQLNVAANVRDVHVAPAGLTSFWLTLETTAGLIQRCLVDDQLNRTCAPQQPPGASPSIVPRTSTAPFAATSVFLQNVDAGVQAIVYSSCADTGPCTAPGPSMTMSPRAGMAALRVAALARNAQPTFFTWEEGSGATATVMWLHAAPMEQLGSPTPGRRPQPLLPAVGRGVVVYDTAGITSTTVTADEVLLARYCL